MGSGNSREDEELNRLYPEGTAERRVLDYSRGSHKQQDVPPRLLGAFNMLMGVSIAFAVISAIAFLIYIRG